jgi:uncharacterized membrane protein SirB2
LSGALLVARGILVQVRMQRFAMCGPVRYASYTIDTVLLAAALMLVAVLPGAAFANYWLAAKLALLVVYIVLGSFALKRAASPKARLACLAAALAVFVVIIGIARTHHPLGWLRVAA